MSPDAKKTREFLHSCERGDLKAVKSFLKEKDSVNVQDEDGHTGLQVAAANDQLDLIRVLLSSGADASLSNSTGWTPLHHAALHGHTDACDVLIKANSGIVNQRNRLGATPLNVAAAGGHLSTVKLLLANGALLEDEDSPPPQFANCPSPVATAALYGREAVLRALLDKKPAMLNAAIPGSRLTPLMLTAVVGLKPLAEMLVERGADPNKLSALNATALDMASACGNSEVRAFLEKKTSVRSRNDSEVDSSSAFFECVRAGDLEGAAAFLSPSSPVDLEVDSPDPSTGATALMVAAMGGREDMARMLLSLGAQVNAQDAVNGWTALMQAVFYSHRSVALVLLERGADPTITAFNGCTALDLATLMEESDTEILRLLAGHTIDLAPPSISFFPRSKKGLGAQQRSASTTALDQIKADGGGGGALKTWWEKVSGRFRRLKHDNNSGSNRVSINIIPDEPVNHDKKNNFDGFGGDLEGASVFTLGFAAATTDLSSYLVSNPVSAPKATNGASGGGIYQAKHKDKSRSRHGMPKGKDKSAKDKSSKEKSVKDKRSDGKSKHLEKSVRSVLKNLSLEEYAKAFEREEVDFLAFKELKEADLVDLGVKAKHRDAILKAIKNLSA